MTNVSGYTDITPIKRPLLINVLISFHSVKFFYLLASFLFIWSLGRNGLIPGVTPLILTRLAVLTSVLLVLQALRALGLFYMRRWARLLIIFLALCGVFSKAVGLFMNIDAERTVYQKVLHDKNAKAGRLLSKKDIINIRKIIKDSRALTPEKRNKGASASLKVLGELLDTSRKELAGTKIISYEQKAVPAVLMLIDLVILLYFFTPGVTAAFRKYGALRFKEVFHIKQGVMALFALFFILIIGDRTYAFIMWKIAKVPDHLMSYPVTEKRPLKADTELLRGLKEYAVEGYSIYLPAGLSAYRHAAENGFSVMFLNENLSFLCGVSPLTKEEYRLQNVPKKARWNPVLLLLKGTYSADTCPGPRPSTKFIHSDGFYGSITKSFLKNNRACFDYDLIFDGEKGLEITFCGAKEELDENVLNSIIASVEPVKE